jgi:hypothetical protein
MSTTPNLLLSLIASNQASKEVTANSAISNLELALTNQLAKVLTDANYTLADPGEARQNMVFTFTGTLTAGRNIIVPASKKLYVVSNQTTGGFNVTVKTASGSGFAVSNTSAGSPPSQPNYTILYCDGTNVFCVNQTDIDTAGSSILPVTFTVTSAQLKALFTTPVQLLPAPGSGLAYEVIALTSHYRYGTTAYTVGSFGGVRLIFNGGSTGNYYWFVCAATGFVDQTSDQFQQGFANSSGQAAAIQVNQPLLLAGDTANPTLGDGTLTLTVDYKIINTTAT